MTQKKNEKPIDMQHEEEMAKQAEQSQLDRIEDQIKQMVGSLKDMVGFLQDMVKMEYEKDGEKKTGSLWTLIKSAKKIGSF